MSPGTPSVTPTSTSIPTIAPRAALAAPDALWIDLRSPGEFAVDAPPGAHNVPLFDDVERAVVGTLYKRRSPEEAFREAQDATRAKIAELVGSIAELVGWSVPPVDLAQRVDAMCAGGIAGLESELKLASTDRAPERAVVLSCWRGGLRSRSVVALLRSLGLDRAVLVEGGYKAYRAEVRAFLETWQPPTSFVLRGLTGVGKSLVLRAIERLRPGWTVDLEALAGHRSSILGMVGLSPVSQKAFESRLRVRLEAGLPGLCVLEGESRKVGDTILPPRIWDALQAGTSIELTATIPQRVDVLIDDYLAQPANRDQLARQLPFVEERLGAKWSGRLVGLLAERRDAELVELLLEHYYDPLYRHSERGYRYALRVDACPPERAAREIVDWIESRTAVAPGP